VLKSPEKSDKKRERSEVSEPLVEGSSTTGITEKHATEEARKRHKKEEIKETKEVVMSDLSVTSPTVVIPQIKEPSAKSSSPDKGISVTFSGFSDSNDRGFTNKEKDILTQKILKLGGEVVSQEKFQKNKFTHMVTPPGSKTMKSLAASLTSKWMITDIQWIHHSALAGYFLPEDDYGVKIYYISF